MAAAVATRATKPRAVFPAVVTASTWSAVVASLWKRAQDARGLDTVEDGTAPTLSNADAVAIVIAWREAASSSRFPLWYQFAAVAYGWDPPENDTFNPSQGAELYPSDVNIELWREMNRQATEMDADGHAGNPRVAFNGDAFDDVNTVAFVRAALLSDGAEAAFKIPIPACKDPKTGKWECVPVTIDDPITAGGKKLLPLALILGAVWFATRKPRRRRRN